MNFKKIRHYFKANYFLRKLFSYKFLNYFLNEDYIRKKIFKYIFSSGYWSNYITNSNESLSGKGSNFKNASFLKDELIVFFNENNVKNILDIGCGDFNWMSDLLQEVNYETYLGIDIVEKLIEKNKIKYNSEKINFLQCDVVSDNLSLIKDVDFILVRHVFIHLKNSNIIKVINKLKEIDFKYLAITSDPFASKNKDLKTEGRYRDINLIKGPFFLDSPIKIIKEYAPGVVKNVDLNIYNNSIKLK